MTRYFGVPDDPVFANNGCNDTAAVTWDFSGGAGALQITATFANEPSAVDVGAWVSGDFGGSVSDIADGSFASGGALSIGVLGSTATFASPSFLTVPEPGDATLLVRRRPRAARRRPSATAAGSPRLRARSA